MQTCRFPFLAAGKNKGDAMDFNWVICFVLETTEVRKDGIALSLDALRQMATDSLGKIFPVVGRGVVVMITETSLDEKEGILYAVTQRVDNNKG